MKTFIKNKTVRLHTVSWKILTCSSNQADDCKKYAKTTNNKNFFKKCNSNKIKKYISFVRKTRLKEY